MADDDEAPNARTSFATWLKIVRQELPAIVALLVLAVSGFAGVYAPVTATKQLAVVGSLLPVGDHSEIRGRVLQDGDNVSKALVWAIVTYSNGQHDSPPATQTDEKGGFSIGPVQNTLGTPCAGENVAAGVGKTCPILEATIYAKKEIPAPAFYRSATTLRGQDSIRPAGAVSQEVVELSPYKLLPLPAIFLVSAMLPFFGRPTQRKYLAAIVLAFLFTGLMIFYLGFFLRYVYTSTAGKSQDVLALGFANVYQGTYVEKVQPEWLFSFTAPPPKPTATTAPEPTSAPESTPAATTTSQTAAKTVPATGQPGAGTPPVQPGTTSQPKESTNKVPVDQGFGAPLWVLLMSVLGAGVLTVAMIVEEITQMGEINQKPEAQQPAEIRKHLQVIVQHQFFILFAPITAIFVYQIMIAGSAATSTFTVALTALGAGPSLSALLTKAGSAAAKLLAPDKKP